MLFLVPIVALGKSEDSLQAAIAAASTPSSVNSPSFSMGWSPYLWPASVADLSMLSKCMYPIVAFSLITVCMVLATLLMY